MDISVIKHLIHYMKNAIVNNNGDFNESLNLAHLNWFVNKEDYW